MPVHFAAARSTAHSPIARALARKALARAANDNGDGRAAAPAAPFDHFMRGALKHFAEHGMGAAEVAREQVELAAQEGDADAFQWWLGVCRALDRNLAARLENRIAGRSALIY